MLFLYGKRDFGERQEHIWCCWEFFFGFLPWGFTFEFGNSSLCILYSSLFSILVKLLIVFAHECKQICQTMLNIVSCVIVIFAVSIFSFCFCALHT